MHLPLTLTDGRDSQEIRVEVPDAVAMEGWICLRRGGRFVVYMADCEAFRLSGQAGEYVYLKPTTNATVESHLPGVVHGLYEHLTGATTAPPPTEGTP